MAHLHITKEDAFRASGSNQKLLEMPQSHIQTKTSIMVQLTTNSLRKEKAIYFLIMETNILACSKEEVFQELGHTISKILQLREDFGKRES